ncbi:hypothetical protein FACS1894110_23680 [Spirochaetia bacterium]|nr:hypothetical protein FACS1894110_23680 [Spirochaetia bacterium]
MGICSRSGSGITFFPLRFLYRRFQFLAHQFADNLGGGLMFRFGGGFEVLSRNTFNYYGKWLN